MRVLGLIESPDHVCGRYRIRAFASGLEAAGHQIDVAGLEPKLLPRLRQLHATADYDVVILQRKLLPVWQLRLLRKRVRRLVFDFDDAVLYRDSNDRRGPHSSRRTNRFRALMHSVDQVIAGNGFLAECARNAGAGDSQVTVIPTCVDPGKYPLPERSAANQDTIDLTWIGSASTLRGLESQSEIWERVGAEVRGSRLRLICDTFPQFSNLPVVPIAWSEATEAKELARADVGVSWIPDGLWSRGKCGLKILQYMAAGLPVVTNPVGVHPEMVHPGENGHLATTADEWIAAIRYLRDHPAERLVMGQSARRFVETHYSVAAWTRTFVQAVSGQGTSIPAPRLLQSSRSASAAESITTSLGAE